MATYRNTYDNYYSDKGGNHTPVGTILPVFVGTDQQTDGEDPEYTYKDHLYCDGKELLIRDYPALFSIIRNRYGGATGVTVTQPTVPGGLRRSYIINNKLFFQFYKDATNDKVNIQRPYPYGAVLRFNTLGQFPTTSSALNTNTFYRLIQPTEDVSAYAETGEFAYELVLPSDIDLSTFPSNQYVWTFVSPSLALHPNIAVSKTFSLSDYPYNLGTFKLPDYRQRKILGFGNVNGAGTATPENAINNFVGQTGGRWYIQKGFLVDSGEFFNVGDVKTTGYSDIIADVTAYVTGEVKYSVGPIDDYVFPFPPAHNHRILSVEVDETKLAELGPAEVDRFAVNYINSRANITNFEPVGANGDALGHSHGIIGTTLQSPAMATYGNTEGIGERDDSYNYSISEADPIPLLTITYDSNSGFITINTDGNHGFSVGDTIVVTGATPSQFSGIFEVVATGFGAANFNVLPRTNETPGVETATLNSGANVKLAGGYFVEQEITQPPRVYVVNGDTLVGGKQADFEIPGNAITLSSETITSAQSKIIPLPDPDLGTVIGIQIILKAPGGGGSDSDNDGSAGGTASVTLDVDGTLYTITANGGGGAVDGNSGGTGGSGGTLSIPAELALDPRFTFSVTEGADGATGGGAGSSTALSYGGGASGNADVNAGGNGVSTAFESTTDVAPVKYTDDGSWDIPAPFPGETSRTITFRVSGGGGGSGNPNGNSGCGGSWPGWPTSTTGKSGAVGGYGGRGALLTGTLALLDGTVTWEIGKKGNAGFNNKDGNTGTGGEAGPALGGIGGGSTYGGNSGVGAWGNGSSGGGGGGCTGLFLDGVLIAGAGGGGGGGGAGGGYNGGGTTDGCYPGGNNRSATESVVQLGSAIDFADGSNGSSGSCTAGAGGGGGGGAGVPNQNNGGVGGQAGAGHNGNGGGTGGRRGTSAYRTDFWGEDGMTYSTEGSLPTTDGYVEIEYTYNTLNYDPVGGGGGQGGAIIIEITDLVVPVSISLGNAGSGGGTATDGGSGSIFVRYAGQEAGSVIEGELTTPTGVYFEGTENGTPTGAPRAGNVWLSSTDDQLKQRAFGLGTGTTSGFSSANIPFANNKITQYINFTGAAADSGGDRQLSVGTFDLSSVNTIRFTVIKGNSANGGESPDEALNLYFQKGASTNTTLFSQILLANDPESGWQTIDLPIADGSAMRDANVTLILSQDRPNGANDNATANADHYGLGAITLFYAPQIVEQFVSTGGASLQGNLDDAGLPINSDTGISQVRRTVTARDATLTVTDGTFTMSSSTPIVTNAQVVPESDIPLITKYFRVKYLIKAL